ncbi:MAG: hypothetical protein ACE5KZ_16555, partial [Candidatus Scalinduaceae bacterium]
MVEKKKGKKVYKNGFNLIEAYPIKFSKNPVSIKYDGPAENFKFSFPEKKIEHVIVNLCPTEPWALPNWAVLKNDTRDFLNKLETVRAEYFPDSHYHVVINHQETNLVNELNQYKTQKDWLHEYTLEPVYPHDAPVLIVKKILGLKLAFGQNTIEHGILLLDPQTVTGIFEHYIQKNEFNTRLIPISGTGLNENKILNVKPGTPIQKILDSNIREDVKYRVFVDGPLNGSEVKDLMQKIEWSTKNLVVLEEKDYKIPFPYTKFNELLFTTSLIGESRRCVYCNYCDDICPVGLEPALYWFCYIRGEKQKAHLYALEKCIECGLCSFICPSKLELLQVIKECKLDAE